MCGAGYRLASYAEVGSHSKAACNALNAWSIARLADGGAMMGPGRQCPIIETYDKRVGDSLCVTGEAAIEELSRVVDP